MKTEICLLRWMAIESSR